MKRSRNLELTQARLLVSDWPDKFEQKLQTAIAEGWEPVWQCFRLEPKYAILVKKKIRDNVPLGYKVKQNSESPKEVLARSPSL